ncbi:MAG TPA: hypothetical protein VK783_05515 [Bacteroidia bacterium]|jgi:hypothetical protein|nr:hypothetical protein [Bacteroidia bacterium]
METTIKIGKMDKLQMKKPFPVVGYFSFPIFIVIFLLLTSSVAYSQTMSISTSTSAVTPSPGTAVDLSQNPGPPGTPGPTTAATGAVAEGFLLPNLTTTQMNNISAAAPAGLLLFNTTTQCYEIYSGSVWNPFWCLCSGTPTVTAGALSTSVCSGSTIYLTATGGASSYSWTGPSGFTSNIQNPTLTASGTAGNYTYTVTASNGCGSSTPSTVTITVATGTAVTAGVVNTPVCAGSAINLTCTSGGAGATYTWTGPNSYSIGPGTTSSYQNPTITNATTAAAGTYTVTVDEGTCSQVSTVSVDVYAVPGAPTAPIFQIDPLTNASYVGASCDAGCIAVGQTLDYYVTSTPGVTYNWVVVHGTITALDGTGVTGSGTSSLSGVGTNSVAITWTGAGTNEITVCETQNGCTGPTINLYSVISSTCSCTFHNSSCPAVATSTFTTLAGLSTVTVALYGASGGGCLVEGNTNWYTAGQNDGYGALIQGTYTVSTAGGTVLNLNIGCSGKTGTSSGGGGGGNGGTGDENGGSGLRNTNSAIASATGEGDCSVSSGGGGGATDFRVGGNARANIIAVAGGGGGSDADIVQACNIGGGRGNNGSNAELWFADFLIPNTGNGATSLANLAGQAGSTYQAASDGGNPGTTTAAGAAVTGSDYLSSTAGCSNSTPYPPTSGDTHCSVAGSPSTAGGTPAPGDGGNGGLSSMYSGAYSTCCYSCGGGGGGGYYGGSGACGAGGPGGSSYAAPSFTVTGVTPQGNSSAGPYNGNGYIIITW